MMEQYGLIGYPLKNSFSETYFNTRFQTEGLNNCRYQNFPIQSIEELPQLLAQNPDIKGLNVTIPHKQNIIPYLDGLDTTAANIGAVNCISKQPDGKWIGYNTDVYGFEKSLTPLLHNTPYKALVLGTGGAAKAVVYVLTQLNIPYQMVSRNTGEGILQYNDLTDSIIDTHRLIINCTPLGMFPDIESALPIPYQAITANHIAYDLVYLPKETRFLFLCKNQGATIQNGLNMLHLQADKAWNIWQPDRHR